VFFDLAIIKTLAAGSRRFRLDARLATDATRLALFGPSGAGKSLCLRALAGLLTPDAGRIEVAGRAFYDAQAGVNLPARARRVGFVFQHYALFPHLTVRENVAFGLKRPLRGLRPGEKERVDETLAAFGLDGLACCLPRDLSGGQRQRAALARALVTKPDLLLLDEPFSALDAPLRGRLRAELAAVLDGAGLPAVLVTHDPEEAASFAQAVALVQHGGVEEMLGPGHGRPVSAAALAAAFDAS
jgi:molybdate transport system ATP-binding protein